MQDKVKDAEEKLQKERIKCQEKVSQVERDFNEKERSLMEKLKRDMNNMV
jgi:Skp family chaperone for outer membrane proteins